jgi:hypothetical protein
MDRTAAAPSPGPRRRSRPLIGMVAMAAVPFFGAAPLRAAPEPPPFPPASEFRSLQLITLACSRENSAEACDKARRVADPFLDHPRLPASCKDVLWTIRQQAVVATSNSFSRREVIDRAARSLTAVCRQQDVSPAKSSAGGAPKGPGRINLISPGQN